MASRRIVSTLIGVLLCSVSAGAQTPPASAPSALKIIDANGARLPYVEQGRGEPVVFVHGAISDYRTWDRQRAAMADKGFRAISYTQRWFGTESWSNAPIPGWITTHAADLAAFIRALDAGPAHLVAWSHGGHIALNVALRNPELVRSAFVFEPVVPSYVNEPGDQKALSDDAGAMVGPALEPMKAGDLETGTRLFLDGVSEQRGYFAGLPPSMQKIVLDNVRTMPAMLEPDQGAPISCVELGQIKPRVAIVRGADVRPFFRVIADAAARCTPQGKHIVVPGQKHMWPGEDVAGFTATVADFILGR
jgi:pimeloyl-ACP methyl ester carboxylesterase